MNLREYTWLDCLYIKYLVNRVNKEDEVFLQDLLMGRKSEIFCVPALELHLTGVCQLLGDIIAEGYGGKSEDFLEEVCPNGLAKALKDAFDYFVMRRGYEAAIRRGLLSEMDFLIKECSLEESSREDVSFRFDPSERWTVSYRRNETSVMDLADLVFRIHRIFDLPSA